MVSPEERRGFERAAEHEQTYGDVAQDYSSRDQAVAAAELARVAAQHKAVDTELAGKAMAMLREMVDSGGDLDLDAVRALSDEAQREDEEEKTEFFVNAPTARERVEMQPPMQEQTQVWETWRQHLLDVGAMDATGELSRGSQELGLTKEQVDYISDLQRAEYLRGGFRAGVRQPRAVG